MEKKALTDEQYNAIDAILSTTIESDTVRAEIMYVLDEAVAGWTDSE